MRAEIARFSARDAAAFDGFLDALRPIYEDGILDAGRRPFERAADLARFAPRLVRLGAALPLHRLVARHFEHPRIREAFSFHSLFIGGDPFRVPAIYAALVYLQFLDGVWYARGGVYSLVEAMARGARRALRRARGAHRAHRRRGARRGARGRRADRRRRRRVQRRRPAHARAARCARRRCAACGRRCRASCSTSARTAGSTRCCTTRCWWATGYRRVHPRRHARRAAAVHLLDLRARPGAHGAGDGRGGRRLALRAAPGAQPARRPRLGARRATACATRCWPTPRRRSAWRGCATPSSPSTA